MLKLTAPAVLLCLLLAASSAAQEVTVGVYYYPWYSNDFHGGQYLRERLVPQQLPQLGEYNDRDPEVLEQHFEWARYAGIDLWVFSWWGPGSREDNTTKDHILPHPDLGNLKLAPFYETTGLTSNFGDLSGVDDDFVYLADTYFAHPNCYRIQGRPVVFVYLTRVLSHEDKLDEFVAAARAGATSRGYDVYLVGDEVFGGAPGSHPEISLLDAVTEYDGYGSMGATGYAGQAAVDAYDGRQTQWKQLATNAGVGYIPVVTPGFNDTAVRDGHAPVSRKLTAESGFGSLFSTLLAKAIARTDPAVDRLLMITSWNEWHEDTQIEPVAIAPPTATDDSPTGTDYTDGLEYEGYGLRYLDILRGQTSEVANWRAY